MELAVFGAILIFILGIMIRYSLNFNYAQRQSLIAMRMAMSESFKSAEAGRATRNVSTVMFVEDRTTADLNKFGSASRAPFVAAATAIFSKNLLMPVDFGDEQDLPVMDIYINGKHFVFSVAGFKEYDLTSPSPPANNVARGVPNINFRWNVEWDRSCGGRGCRKLFTVNPNMPTNNHWDPNCLPCFDLYRDGFTGGPDDVTQQSDRDIFAWQWRMINGVVSKDDTGVNLDKGINTSVDLDGDLKEELILDYQKSGAIITMVRVLDFQEGDIDSTYNDFTGPPEKRPGLKDDIQIYTYARDGTYLLVEEGKQGADQVVKSTQKRNVRDIVQRAVQLSNNTGRVCNNPTWNPDVDVCVNSNIECFNSANIYQTCYATDSKVLYVRSRIGDLRGRKWITNLGTRGF